MDRVADDFDDLVDAVKKTVVELEGAYALVVMSADDPEMLVLARQGCPVVIGLGIDENFVASDVALDSFILSNHSWTNSHFSELCAWLVSVGTG